MALMESRFEEAEKVCCLIFISCVRSPLVDVCLNRHSLDMFFFGVFFW